jgi:antitoxin (DNA-binding transcriptional repressor) of toxin-antitoxin stability system
MTDHLKQKFKRANEIRSTEGYSELLKKSIGFMYRISIRKRLPTSDYYTNAGIPVREKKPLDPIIPGINYSDNPDHEYALVSELLDHVKEGDDIVIVGAGSGTTTIIAANQATESRTVIAFEGSESRVQQARNTIAINGMQNKCKVRHAIVGPPIHLPSVKEDESDTTRLSPEQLPECDVLELDCEGAEKQILEKLDITPRCIIVETHPVCDSGPKEIRRILDGKGYKISNKIDRCSVPVLTAVLEEE